MEITPPDIKDLKRTAQLTKLEAKHSRVLILWYIYFCKAVYVPQCITAKINDIPLFNANAEIARMYFLSFQIDE